MKRFGNLYNEIISLENLYLAELKARKGKQKSKEIIQYLENLDENIKNLQYGLKNKTYCISKYSHFTIHEPKERKISKLPYKDRIVHHAIINVIGPILLNSFISQTYSCIKNRGIHKGLNTLTSYLKNIEETRYCLKMDIKKFYPSIDNELLKILLRRKFKDNDLLWLLDLIISSHKGLPLGNYTSQWLANYYLNSFCHWIKEIKKVKYFLLYCDDIVILSNDKECLHKLKIEIQNYLKIHLHLELSKYQVFPVKSRGIDFLGYVSFHSHIRLRKRIKLNWINMLNKYPNIKSINSYNGWLNHCNSKNLKTKYLKDGQKRSIKKSEHS